MKKLGETLKSNMYGIIGMIIIAGASWFGGTFKKGHDANQHEYFISQLTTDDAIDIWDSIFESKTDEKSNDFRLLDKIMKSPFVSEYVRQTSEKLENKIVADYEKRDSTKGDMIHSLGAGTGIRNEDVMNELIKLLKAFKEGKLYSSRTVHAVF